MRRCLTPILLLLAACSVASAAPRLTVRERLQETLAKTLELQAKAVAGDPKVVEHLILMPVEDGDVAPPKDGEWGAVFPTLEQLKAYGLIRPAAMLYAPLEHRRVTHVEGYDNLPLPAPLQFDKQDAPGLRKMLKDPDPALRSLATSSAMRNQGCPCKSCTKRWPTAPAKPGCSFEERRNGERAK